MGVDRLCCVFGSGVCLEVGLPWAGGEVGWSDVGVCEYGVPEEGFHVYGLNIRDNKE